MTLQVQERGMTRGIWSFWSACAASTIVYFCLNDPQTIASKMLNAAKVVTVGIVTGIATNGFLGFLEHNIVSVRNYMLKKDKQYAQETRRALAVTPPSAEKMAQDKRQHDEWMKRENYEINQREMRYRYGPRI